MFPLLRLPMLAAKEVFRAMNPIELFVTSILSRRAKSAIKSCHQKYPICIDFSFTYPFARFVLTTEKQFYHLIQVVQTITTNDSYKIGTEKFKFAPDSTSKKSQWEPMASDLRRTPFGTNDFRLVKCMRLLVHHIVEVFYNPVVNLNFKMPNEEFALELLQFFKSRNLKLNRVQIDTDVSPKVYKEVLEECSNVNILCMGSKLPVDFEYSPTKPLKVGTLSVTGTCRWVKLEDYMQCRRVELYHNEHHCIFNMDPNYLNEFFKKFINTDCELENLQVPFGMNDLKGFAQVIKGLNARLNNARDSAKIRKRDGKRLKIQLKTINLIMKPVNN